MRPPKITAARVVSDRVLVVEFAGGESRRYDISALLTREAFAPLKNPALFKAVTVEPGGYAVSWGQDIHRLASRGCEFSRPVRQGRHQG